MLDEDHFAARVADIEREARRQEKDALATYGMLEGTDPRISPLRRALAIWGLTADDIGVLSIHGTSTGANVCVETLFSSIAADDIFRKRMRRRFGTTSSPTSHVHRVTPFPSLHKRVCSVTRKAALHPGS